jgi:hypothetical protein
MYIHTCIVHSENKNIKNKKLLTMTTSASSFLQVACCADPFFISSEPKDDEDIAVTDVISTGDEPLTVANKDQNEKQEALG